MDKKKDRIYKRKSKNVHKFIKFLSMLEIIEVIGVARLLKVEIGSSDSKKIVHDLIDVFSNLDNNQQDILLSIIKAAR